MPLSGFEPATQWLEVQHSTSEPLDPPEALVNPLLPDDAWRHHPVNSGWCIEAMLIQLQVSPSHKIEYFFVKEQIHIANFYVFNDGFDLAVF